MTALKSWNPGGLRVAGRLFVVFVVTVVFAGWALDKPRWRTFLSVEFAMNPMMAVCLLAAVIGSLAAFRTDLRGRLTCLTITAAIGTVGLSRILDILFGSELELDLLLFGPALQTIKGANHIAPHAAINLVLLAGAFACIGFRRLRAVAELACMGVMALSLLAISGYLLGAGSLYSIGTEFPLALSTAICFAILAIILLVESPHSCGFLEVLHSRSASGTMARRFLPLAIAGPILCAWLNLVAQDKGGIPPALALTISTIVAIVGLSAVVMASAFALFESEQQHAGAAEAARQAEHRFQVFMDNCPAHSFIKDQNGRFVFVNRAMEMQFGGQGSWIGKRDADIFPPELAAKFSAEDREVLARNQTIEVLDQMITSDGGCRHFLTVKFPVADSAGEHLVGGIAVDVTERHRAEAEAERARAAAEAATKAKSQFLAHMSHEIRTPLNGVLGLQAILAETALDANQRELIGIAQSSGNALLGLINDILDVSKIEAGQMTLEAIAFRPRQVIEEALKLFRPQITAKGLALCCRIDDQLPAVTVGDPTRLRQVLINLLSNALKFTDTGKISLEVSLLPDGLCRFELSDTGPGLTDEAQCRLFQAFMQADNSTTRRFGGSGLGLAIASQLTALMGGSIGVTSQPGCGSTFWFAVPLKPCLDDPAGMEGSRKELPATLPLRVLVAEDDSVNQLIINTLLAKLGYKSKLVTDGVAALEALKSDHFDLVLMDCHMPGMDGYRTTQLIREASGGLPKPIIIAVSADAMADNKERCAAAGMNGFVSKPVQLRSLTMAIDTALAQQATAAAPGGVGAALSA